MTLLSVTEAVVGGLLVFFVPGYCLTKAVFPEWRVRIGDGGRRLLEVVTLSFVASVGLTVLVGYGVLNLASGGFAASWSDPLLEACLGATALIGFAVAAARGAFSRVPPTGPRQPEGPAGEEGAWEISRELDRLGRDERRLQHEIRVASGNAAETQRLTAELESVRAEKDTLRRKREEEYAT